MAVHDSMDTQLAKTIRGVVKWEPHSNYRLTGSFLQSRGWKASLKRIHHAWGNTFISNDDFSKILKMLILGVPIKSLPDLRMCRKKRISIFTGVKGMSRS